MKRVSPPHWLTFGTGLSGALEGAGQFLGLQTYQVPAAPPSVTINVSPDTARWPLAGGHAWSGNTVKILFRLHFDGHESHDFLSSLRQVCFGKNGVSSFGNNFELAGKSQVQYQELLFPGPSKSPT